MSDSNTSQACRGLLWNYDAWGNRTDQTVTAGTCNTFHATVNTQNQLVDPVNNVYKYDAAGDLTNDGNHTYSYDAENRLIKVDAGSAATYVYDALDRRVEKIVAGHPTDYLYDASGNVSNELNDVCAPVCVDTDYLYLGGQLVAEYKKGLTYFVHTDHLGSERLVTGLNQAVVQNLDYLPFGEHNSTDSAITTHEFTGDERDAETSLDHTQFRQYSSQFARWITPDPLGLAAADLSNPQSLNRYAYVENDPIDFLDPSGGCTVAPDREVFSCPPPGPSPSTLLLEAGCPRGSNYVPVPFSPNSGWCVPGEKEGDFVKQPSDRGNSSGPDGPQKPTVRAAPTLKFKPPSWDNFTHEFLPCWGGQIVDHFIGSTGKARVTFGTVALAVKSPVVGGPLLVLWTGIGAFKAGATCAVASRAVYQ